MFFVLFSFCFASETLKKCKDMGFCTRNINLTGNWKINEQSISMENNEFSANLINNDEDAQLKLIVHLIQETSFRIRVLPLNTENFKRYMLSDNELVVDQNIINQHLPIIYTQQQFNEGYGYLIQPDNENIRVSAKIIFNPFTITVIDEFNSSIKLNSEQGLVFEHTGEYVPPDIWPYFRNDTIKYGATAVSLDFEFPGKNTRLLGFSESFERINLEDTIDEPKRSSNFDYFAEYGHIPLVYGHSPTQMISFFWLNPSDTVIKIGTNQTKDSRNIRILSEGGYLDTIIFTGNFQNIIKSYTNLTGRHDMPPIFTLGYHQSKWGYKFQTDVESVIDNLDNINFPFDAMWLDVDHLENHAPFYFNKTAFPNPEALFNKLAQNNRYLVRLNDPHLPNSQTHKIYQEALSKNFLVNISDGVTPYSAICWPGTSSWPDFLNPEVRKWWSSLYAYTINETAKNVFFWNDMDEPSVFSEVEGTFPKDLVHFQGYEAREIRSLYALLMVASTYEGVLDRNEDHNLRVFILTRGYFAGSQKYAWMWSGDNTADWDYLQKSISMALVAGMCGMPLTGTDLGGFNNNPNDELLYRWYQAGALGYPFYRSHCHEDSPHREPFLYGNRTQELLRNATVLRYRFIPMFYTAIRKSHLNGQPPILPLFTLFPEIEHYHDNDNEFILAESVLVNPVLEENMHEKIITKPPGRWFDFSTGHELSEGNTTIPVFDSTIPIYLRGGKIITLFSDAGKNVNETIKKPLQLIVACDENGNAEGELYMDDGCTYNYNAGSFMSRKIVYSNNNLKFVYNEDGETEIPKESQEMFINKITFYGIKGIPNIIDDSDIYCANGTCIMANIKLYPYLVQNDQKKDSKIMYIAIGCVTGAVIIIAIMIVILKKMKHKKDELNSKPLLTNE